MLGLSPEAAKISIHALREEGDKLALGAADVSDKFLSTPSARRATYVDGEDILAEVFLSTPSARRATNRLCVSIHL